MTRIRIKLSLLVTILIYSSCTRGNSSDIIYTVTGLEIYNITQASEDCNKSMIAFQLEIENNTDKPLELNSGFEKGICVYNRLEPELNIRYKGSNTMQLKIISNDSVIQPNSTLKIKAVLVNYDFEGSLIQMKEAFEDELGLDFHLEGDFIKGKGLIDFSPRKKLNYTYILNNDFVKSSDKESMNEGKLPKVVFRAREELDFVPPR